jgi:hypothetical protein
MMLRNPPTADPENNPAKAGFPPAYGNQSYNQGFHQPQPQQQNYANDDPWYKSSPQSSPQGAPQQPSSSFYQPSNVSYNSNPAGAGYGEEDYENEPPLLEELGIHFDHILAKTQAVLYLNKVLVIRISLFF